jgi:hypothetical protein
VILLVLNRSSGSAATEGLPTKHSKSSKGEEGESDFRLFRVFSGPQNDLCCPDCLLFEIHGVIGAWASRLVGKFSSAGRMPAGLTAKVAMLVKI